MGVRVCLRLVSRVFTVQNQRSTIAIDFSLGAMLTALLADATAHASATAASPLPVVQVLACVALLGTAYLHWTTTHRPAVRVRSSARGAG